MVYTVQSHNQKSIEMKKNFVIFFIVLLFVSCTSIPTTDSYPLDKTQETNSDINNSNGTFLMSSDVFDILQRPLGHTLSSQCKQINRLNWEYYMTGIGWWDIYLLSGRKLGNGVFEKNIENKSNCQIIELHTVKSAYDSSVLMVELIFVSSDKTVLENLQTQFKIEAVNFFGEHGKVSNDKRITWTAAWYFYTSYPIQQYENGKWVYLISSFDSANSPY